MQKIGHKLPYSELENTSVEFTLSDIKTRLKLVEKNCNKKNKVLWTQIIEHPTFIPAMSYAQYEDEPFLPEHFLSLFSVRGLGCADTLMGNYTTDGRTKMLNFLNKNEYYKNGNVYTKFKGCIADEPFSTSNILIFDRGLYNQNFILTDEFFEISGIDMNPSILGLNENILGSKTYTDSQLIFDLSLHDESYGTFLDIQFFNKNTNGKHLFNLQDLSDFDSLESIKKDMGEEWFEYLYFPLFQNLSIATYFEKNRISRVFRLVFDEKSIAKNAQKILQNRLKFKDLGARKKLKKTFEELILSRTNSVVDFRIVKFRNRFILEMNLTENENVFSKTGPTEDCFNSDRPMYGSSILLNDIIFRGYLTFSYKY